MNASALNRRTLIATGGAALAAGRLRAQGFAGLGTEAGGFAIPKAETAITFPADHGPHPRFRIEWWYVTSNLTGEDGVDYGIQWTLFRSAFSPGGAQAWMGHAALTTPTSHRPAERLARGGMGLAGVEARPFAARIDDWSMEGPTLREVTLKAAGTDFAYELALAADGPFVMQGNNGYSVKSAAGQASHYYSQPFYRARGRLILPQREIAVEGLAWLDREWSSQPLEGDQTGWDWFSIHLDDGAKLMGFQLRAETGPDFTAATWIEPDGTATPFEDGAFQATPLATAEVAGREIPVHWRIRLSARNLDAEVRAINDRAWMDLAFAYWEGPVRVTGSHTGRGYLEMTGYG